MIQAITLIDGNNFYASCEQSIDPSLTKKPLVVLSNNDGCIIARSVEARALGIKMGAPYFKIRNKLKLLEVAVRSSNYELYGDMSRRLMKIIESECNEIEIYSIDEAFARIELPSYYDLKPWARRLRERVRQEIGISISVGIGANKVQAKLANHLAKHISAQAGIFDLLTCTNPDPWLETIAIEEVWGIGHQLARWCRLRGIKTAQQLRNMPSHQLRAKYGIVGVRLLHELHGDTCFPLISITNPKKETCVSRSFSNPIGNLNELRQAIATHVVHASRKLRQQRQLAGSITVFTRTSKFKPSFYSKSATTKLNLPSNDTSILLKSSLPLIEQIFRYNCPLIKCGVLMQQLQSTNYLQHNLFEVFNSEEQKRRECLMKLIDQINKSYGKGTLQWAICGANPNWKLRRELMSKCSTTRMEDLPLVKV